jgi:large subunit ribosomal protein L22
LCRACEPILKVLLSAGANAKHNLGMRKSKLFVSECACDEGPTLKRMRCRAQGKGYQIKKRTSHITIKVAEREKVEKAAWTRPAAAATAAPVDPSTEEVV